MLLWCGKTTFGPTFAMFGPIWRASDMLLLCIRMPLPFYMYGGPFWRYLTSLQCHGCCCVTSTLPSSQVRTCWITVWLVLLFLERQNFTWPNIHDHVKTFCVTVHVHSARSINDKERNMVSPTPKGDRVPTLGTC